MSPWHLRQATRCVRQGGLLAYPTEAVWGIGCDPANPQALARLLRLKQRSWRKGLILVASDWSQLRPWLAVDEIPPGVARYWPGHLTCLLPARPDVSPLLRGCHSTLAVRISAHPLIRALCQRAGQAIVSTSANRHGQPSARRALQVRRALGEGIDYLLPGSLGQQTQPSRIMDPSTGQLIRP